LNVIFTDKPHHLQPLVFPKHDCLVSLTKLL
jgi:hypothetical protein